MKDMQRRQFILETDWGWDCDDAVAIRLLCNAHKKGETELLGINVNSCVPKSIPALDVYLRSMGMGGKLLLGLDRDAVNFDTSPSYQELLVQNSRPLLKNEDALPSLLFYKKLFQEAAPKSLEILSIGFTQVLSALLHDPRLAALTAEKVKHLWIMAGKWDEEGGKEYNFSKLPVISRASAYFCDNWPKPITFLGFEAGESVLTGKDLPESDPLKQILRAHGSPNGRCSWDPMLALLALHGSPERAGYKAVYGRAKVDPETGKNYFTPDPAGPHSYVIKSYPDEYYQKGINGRLPL